MERADVTSEERHEARYQRRKAKRLARHPEMKNYNEVFTYEHLYLSYLKCRRGVAWKRSVQNYIVQAPLLVYQTWRELMAGRYKERKFDQFDLYERGKKRHINSIVIRDRVVHKALSDYALDPVLSASYIYDNGASLKNKGYHFSIRRLVAHLQRHYRKHGSNGYILTFDFHGYFDHVDHDWCMHLIHKHRFDARIMQFVQRFLDTYGERGVGLGSPVSQTMALLSANPMDHYIKEKLRIQHYGRYMDDGYLIHESKDVLRECLDHIRVLCQVLNIELNENKTQIVKLTHGFTYLKTRFFLTNTGKVVRKIYKRSVVKQRQKLKKLRKKLDEGVILFEDVYHSFQSWCAYARNFHAWHTIQNMKKLYLQLYHDDHFLYVATHSKRKIRRIYNCGDGFGMEVAA